LLPPARLFTMDGQPVRPNDTETNPHGQEGGYKVLDPVYYLCPVTGQHVVLTPNALMDSVWGRTSSCFPAHLVDLLAPLGGGFDFVSPGGVQVRIRLGIDELGKMSGRWFPDVLRVLEIDPEDSSE